MIHHMEKANAAGLKGLYTSIYRYPRHSDYSGTLVLRGDLIETYKIITVVVVVKFFNKTLSNAK